MQSQYDLLHLPRDTCSWQCSFSIRFFLRIFFLEEFTFSSFLVNGKKLHELNEILFFNIIGGLILLFFCWQILSRKPNNGNESIKFHQCYCWLFIGKLHWILTYVSFSLLTDLNIDNDWNLNNYSVIYFRQVQVDSVLGQR